MDSIDELSDWLDPGTELRSAKGFVPDKMIGQQLSEFLIQERVGSGGMARVYLAYDTILKRHVAVKVIQNRKYVTTESQAALLQSEAISQARLHHQNVVTIFHVGNHDGLPFLAMEYVDGKSLADRLKQENPPTFEETLDYAKQVIEGLREAYGQGLIHGDIKPANLLVSDDGTLKLSDFGLARRAEDEDTITRKLIGTPSFMAPELFSHHPIDEQTDLFSLGVTLFQLTFGRSPYLLLGETAEEVKHEIEVSEIDFPKKWPVDVPLQWKSVLEKLLSKDRSQRYDSVEKVSQDVAAISKQVNPSKPLPKVCSFVGENLLYFFLTIPFLSSVLRSVNFPGWGSTLSCFFWSLGPIAMFVISILSSKSLVQAISQTRLDLDSAGPQTKRRFCKAYSLQIAPMLLLLASLFLVPFFGPTAALWGIWGAIAIGTLQIFDSAIRREKKSWSEHFGQCRIVIDH